MTQHKHGTSSEWKTVGYFGRELCACCGFAALGENRILTVRNASRALLLCDGCVNAIASQADGKEHYTSGEIKDYDR